MTPDQLIAELQKLTPSERKAPLHFYDATNDASLLLATVEVCTLKRMTVVVLGDRALSIKIADANERKRDAANRRHSPDSIFGRIFGD